MILTQHSPGPDIATCAVHEADRPAIVVEGERSAFDQPQEISIQRRFFSHGGQDLALDADLMADAFLYTGVLRLKGWGIEITPENRLDFNLDREIIRKFLDLYSKAQSGRLSDTEREDWASIVEQVDYQRFCAERSPEVYAEGQVLQRDEDGWRVSWHDGTEQYIPHGIGQPLCLVDEGERFGAMVRFGKDRAVKSIALMAFLPEPAATGEELWQSWAPANS